MRRRGADLAVDVAATVTITAAEVRATKTDDRMGKFTDNKICYTRKDDCMGKFTTIVWLCLLKFLQI